MFRFQLTVLFGVLALTNTTAEAQPARPHIIFILADDLGIGDVGCYGGQIPTPHIDRLADQGIRFEQYYAASPICSPSRCGLVTGQYPGRWRITSYLAERARNRGAEQADFLDPQAPSLPRTLKAAGYRTVHIGKWHLGGGRDVKSAPKFAAYGYDEHAGTYESPEPAPDITAIDWIWSPQDKVKRWKRTEFFVDKALDFLRRNQDAPCFVNLWLDDVHTPWIPDAQSPTQGGNVRKNLVPVLTELDRQIGRLAAGLKELGIEERTLLIFTSDNGPYPHLPGRTMGLRGCKLSLYEGGIRVPLIVRWPGTVPVGGVDTTTLFTAIDMFPTLCQIADANLPADVRFDGEDLSAALHGQPKTARAHPLFWEYGRNAEFFGYPAQPTDRSPNLAVRDGRWKLLVNADGSGEELYDLDANERETDNVAADNLIVASRLKRAVLEWRKRLLQLSD
jgi:arylsulfatase A-like enzyme